MVHSIDDLVLYQDEKFLVINKPTAIPVQYDLTKDKDLKTYVESYLGREVYMVNRIDRPVSGVVIFALSKRVYNTSISLWKEESTIKKYIAIVEGKWEVKDEILKCKLLKGRNNKAIVHPQGKPSQMMVSSYPVYDRYSLCSIQLHSGRFHQIRAMLSNAGFPIKGDVKYGARRKNHNRSIHLHCREIKIQNILHVVAPLPEGDVLWKKAKEFLKEIIN